MERTAIGLVFRVLFFIALQVFVLNNIRLGGIINPFLYIYVLLVLPVDFSPNVGLLIAFLLGLSIDVLSNTLGMHTVATVFAAYCRPFVMRYRAPRDGYEFSRIPSVGQMGIWWFISYSAIIILLHHFTLFFVEAFRISGFWMLAAKTTLSASVTLVLAIALQLLTSRPTRG